MAIINLEGRSQDEFFAELSTKPMIKEIRLRGARFHENEKGIGAICSIVRASNVLEVLELRSCVFSSGQFSEIAAAIVSANDQIPLHDLILAQSYIHDADGGEISKILKVNKTIVYLDLESTGLKDSLSGGIKKIENALKSNQDRAIQCLNIAGNSIMHFSNVLDRLRTNFGIESSVKKFLQSREDLISAMGGASTESSGVATQVLENSVAPEEPDADANEDALITTFTTRLVGNLEQFLKDFLKDFVHALKEKESRKRKGDASEDRRPQRPRDVPADQDL